MIEFSELIPTMEHAMQGSVVFAALSHGLDVLMKRFRTWSQDRKWAKQDAEWAAIAAPTPTEIVTSLEGKVEAVVEEIKDTVKNKSKKNG